MNILMRELKANRRSLIIWVSVLALLSFLMMSLYPSFADDADKMEELLSAFPEDFLKAFGANKLSMAEGIGWFALETYLLIILFGSMFAVILGSSMLAKEEEEKTIEFLLAKPVTRSQVVTGKLLAFVGYIFAFNFCVGLATFIGFELFVEQYSRIELLRLIAAPFLAHLSFACIGFLLSLFFTRRKSAYSAGIGLVLLTYFLSVIADLAERVRFLRYASPFYYMNAADIVTNGRIDPLHILIVLGVSVFAVGATYFLYNRRDITT
jgi:ABC-2 type transport system permease protein